MKCTHITVYYTDNRKPSLLKNPDGIPRAQLDPLLSGLAQDIEHFMCDIEGEEANVSLDVEFSPARDAFIGWVDEYNESVWYYDNGSGETEPVDLLVNGCPQARLMCRSRSDTAAIITHFCETGERWPGCKWVPDEAI